MENKFTAGEWVSTFGITKGRIVRNKGGLICILTKPSHYPNQDERYEREMEQYKANAKLIAAAPELLEVCKMVEASQIDGSFVLASEWWIKLKKSIKKATL